MGWGAVFFFFFFGIASCHFKKIGRKTYSLLVTRLYLIILIIMVINMLINDQISSEKLNEGSFNSGCLFVLA